jgi:phosphoenolpyruvate carboxylase
MRKKLSEKKGLDVLKENRENLWEIIFEQVEDAKVSEAARILGDLIHSNKDSTLTVSGSMDAKISESLDPLELNAEQHKKLAEVTALMSHTERASNFATAYNEPTINLLDEAIVKLVAAVTVETSESPDGHTQKIISANPVKDMQENPEKRALVAKRFSDIAIDDVMTMHPTYMGTLDYTKAINKLDTAIENQDPKAQAEAIGNILSKSPVIDKNRDAHEENEISIHFLDNARQAVPELYKKFDEVLEKYGFSEKERWDFALNITERSWGLGGGDKDGNSNVFASNMEDGIQLNRDMMQQRLGEDLNKVAELDGNFAQSDGYKHIQENLSTLKKAAVYDNNHALIEETKTLIKETLKDVFMDSESSPEAKEQALASKRTVHTLGLTMGRIELRETADVHEIVLDNILPLKFIDSTDEKEKKYSELPDDVKLLTINQTLNVDKSELMKWVNNAISNTPEGSKESYDDDKANGGMGITHTALQRLKLAAANPDIIKGQVLAEAESPLQFKEMLLLLKATDNEKNVRIVPLFESPDILKNVGTITETMLKDRDYFQYLADISLDKWAGRAKKGLAPALDENVVSDIKKLNPDNVSFKEDMAALNRTLADDYKINLSDVLKIETQLAHSDNTRRGGMLGAKGGIHQAHSDIREVSAKFGFGAVFHEGGSHTDPARMGTRSETDQINTNKSFDFVKSTIQGIDSIMMNNSVGRWVGRKIEVLAHCSTKVGLTRNEDGEKTLVGSTLKREIAGPKMDFIYDALDKQVDLYQDKFFTDDRFGTNIAQLQDYKARTSETNLGLRAAGRKAATADEPEAENQKANTVTTPRGEVIEVPKEEVSYFLDPVGGTRTIGFTQAGIYSQDNPAYLSASTLREELLDGFDKERNQLGASKASGSWSIGDQLNHKAMLSLRTDEDKLNFMYKNDEGLRSAIDPTTYSAGATVIENVWKKAMENDDGTPRKIIVGKQMGEGEDRKFVVSGTETIAKRPKVDELENLAKEDTMKGFLASKELAYRNAVKLGIESITGDAANIDKTPTAELLPMVRAAIPDYKERLEQQDVIIGIAKYQRSEIGEEIEQNTSRSITNMMQNAVMSPAMSEAGKRMHGIGAEQEAQVGNAR